MGNVFKRMDDEKRDRGIVEFREKLQHAGIPPPTASTEHVPDVENNDQARYYWFVATNTLPHATLLKLAKQPFHIGTRPAYSYIERKNMSLIAGDNPFTWTQSEAENRLLNFAGSHTGGLKHGGRMAHHHRHHHFGC